MVSSVSEQLGHKNLTTTLRFYDDILEAKILEGADVGSQPFPNQNPEPRRTLFGTGMRNSLS